MRTYIEKIYPFYRGIRHKIHTHPELRYEEYQTSALVAEQLKKLGLTVISPVGKTGVVGLLDTGRPGKTIGLRADMDALPLIEDSGLPYQSTQTGKMHACGHDGHTATLLATADVLWHLKDNLNGKIKFIFQPAEEGGAGAKAMIDEGVLKDPSVDAIFAFHNYPGVPLGQILVKHDCVMYGNTEFMIEIIGKGGHAAQPELVINPITVGAEIMLAIQFLAEQQTLENEPSVVCVTQFNSGTTTNIVEDKATLVGTIRASSNENIEKVKRLFVKKIDAIEKKYQARIHIVFNNIYPPTINTPFETDFVFEEAQKIFGLNQVKMKETAARASEDFSFFLQQVPGSYFFIGNGEQSAMCHNAKYDFNDEIIKVGSHLFSVLALSYLGSKT